MSLLWCELAWLGGDGAAAGVAIELEGEAIGSVTPGVATPPSGADRLRGLTIPGLANAHSHAFHRALRGFAQLDGGTFWSWREQMYSLAERLDPDSYLALARATFAEMALAGITAVGEFHYLHHGPGGVPYSDANELGKTLIAAAEQAGIRISLLDTCYLHGGIDTAVEGTQRRFADASAEAWAARVSELEGGALARLGAAIHSVRAVDPESAAVVAEWARGREVPLHAHVSEQIAENDASVGAYGRTPTQLLADGGALDARFTAVHATHLGDEEIGLLGQARATCCLCPTTERDLADGVGPAHALAQAGSPLALGSDSHAIIDLFEEARAVELDQRLVGGRRGLHAAADLLRAATEDGHASIGWAAAGRIEAGAPADLTTVAIDGVRLVGAAERHPVEALVFAATGADVRQVIVGGRNVVVDGAHVEVDVAAELREAIAGVMP
jgi:formiminoglutamate deiminase